MLTSLLALCSSGLAQVSVTTYHNDNARTGQNRNEVLLSPARVQAGPFGKRFEYPVDGNVLAQPLVLSSVAIPGKGLRNVVYVVTAHDSVYAFDADHTQETSLDPLWQVSFLDSQKGVTSVPNTDVSCPVIVPELGIVGTPVIDPASLTIYLIAETKEPGPSYVFRLHALDASTGAERPGSPVQIQVPGFVPFQHKQRGALLLSNGIVYVPWGSNCDNTPYHGWIVAYDARTLQQTGVFNVSPDGDSGSFWNAGAGPAADSDGNVFAMSANGDFTASSGGRDYGDSFLKLAPAPSFSVLDYFTPFNQSYLNLNDIDVGSSGPLLLPDEAGSPQHPHLLVSAGKEGRIYLLDREHMGHAQFAIDSLALASLPDLGHSLFGSPAYFQGSVYLATEYSPMRAFPISNASIATAPSSQTPDSAEGLGAVPSVSSNGNQDGIVWTVPFEGTGVLHAYDASDLSRQLYSSSIMPGDALSSWMEFSVPTIAGGKVNVGTTSSLAVYGLFAPAPPSVSAAANAASFQTDAISPGSLITLFGSGLALTTAQAGAVPLPVSVADVSVTVNGLRAPVLFVSPTQINAQVPYEVQPGSVRVIVSVCGSSSAGLTVSVLPAAPGIFTTVNGAAIAINSGGALNSPSNPAKAGSIVSVYFTGIGPLASPLATGSAAAPGEAINAASHVAAAMGGQDADVTFAGPAPGFPGVAQANVTVPALTAGSYALVITVSGQSSNSALIYVAGN